MKSRGIYLELIFLCFQFLILTGLPSSTTGAKSPSVGSVRTKVGTNGTAPSTTTTVKGPPKELTDAADKSVLSVCVRENAALECPLIGLPPPLYHWFKGNERISSVWHRFEGTDQAQLIIRSVTHEDSGTYWCVAVNGFGSKNFSIELNVTGDDPLKNNYLKTSTQKRSSFNGSSPEIIRDHLPRESTVLKQVKGKNLMVKCEAKGNPKPNVTWYKDQQNLTSSRDSVATLKLFNLTDKDDGRYRCEASNKWDKDVYEMTLKVSEAWQEAAEILELNPSNLTLFPGQSGSITCLARLEGATLPLMLWVKRVDDPKLEANKTSKLFLHDGIYYEALNRTDMKETRKNIYATVLPINNASQADAGTYCCAVVGPMGINHSVAEVIIQADPHHVVSVQRRKSEAVQRAVLYALGILVLVLVVIFGYKRYHGCRGPLKNSSVAKKGGGKSGGGGGGVMSGAAKKAAVTTSSKRTSSTGRKGSSLMMAIGKTQVPKRSPGETLSTTLTQTQNDVLQPLVDNNNSRTVSTSESARRAGPLVPYHWPSGGVVLNCGGKHEKLFDQPGVYVDDRTGHYSSSCTSGASDIQTFRTSSSHRQHHHHHHQHRSPYHFSQQLQQQHGHHHHHHNHRGPCESKNVNYIRAEDDSPAMYFVNEVDRMPFPTNSPNTLANSGVYRAGREKGSGGGKRWSSSYSAKNHSSSCSSPDHHQHDHHHHEYRNDIDFTLPLSATHLPVPAPSWESLSSDESSNNSSIAHYYHPAPSRSQHHCHHHHHHHEERCPKIKLSHANNNNSLLSQ